MAVSASRSTGAQRVLVAFVWIALVSAVVAMHNLAAAEPAMTPPSHAAAAAATTPHHHDDCSDRGGCDDAHAGHPCIGMVTPNDDMHLDTGSLLATSAPNPEHRWTSVRGIYEAGRAPPWTVLTSAELSIWRV